MTRANLSLRSALFPLTWASLVLTLQLAVFTGGYFCGYFDGYETLRETSARQPRASLRRWLPVETFILRAPPHDR